MATVAVIITREQISGIIDSLFKDDKGRRKKGETAAANKKVESFIMNSKLIEAKVKKQGSDEWVVVKIGRRKRMNWANIDCSCSCSTTATKDTCFHIAAVLFYARNEIDMKMLNESRLSDDLRKMKLDSPALVSDEALAMPGYNTAKNKEEFIFKVEMAHQNNDSNRAVWEDSISKACERKRSSTITASMIYAMTGHAPHQQLQIADELMTDIANGQSLLPTHQQRSTVTDAIMRLIQPGYMVPSAADPIMLYTYIPEKEKGATRLYETLLEIMKNRGHSNFLLSDLFLWKAGLVMFGDSTAFAASLFHLVSNGCVKFLKIIDYFAQVDRPEKTLSALTPNDAEIVKSLASYYENEAESDVASKMYINLLSRPPDDRKDHNGVDMLAAASRKMTASRDQYLNDKLALQTLGYIFKK